VVDTKTLDKEEEALCARYGVVGERA